MTCDPPFRLSKLPFSFNFKNHKQMSTNSPSLLNIFLLCLFSVYLFSGCTSNDELTGDNFGTAVHHMISMQTSNPSKSPQGLDGQKASLILQKYRKDVADPTEVDKKALGTKTAKEASGE